MNTMKVIGRFLFVIILLLLIVLLFLLEKLCWIWSKLFDLVTGNPRAITGTNPIGAKWVVRKAAKGASWLFGKASYYISHGRYGRRRLWYYSKGKIADYFPNFYQRCRDLYDYLI